MNNHPGPKNILVVGGTGFTGKSVLEVLSARTENYTLFCRDPKKAPPGFNVIEGDLDNPKSLKTALEGKDGMICISSLGFGHAETLVKHPLETGVSRCIFVSTTAVLTQLNAPSKAIRLAAESHIRNSRLQWTILRPTMIYGRPGDRNMERLVKLISRYGIVPIPGNGKSLQQPIFVDDVATAVTDAFFSNNTLRKTYNISGRNPLSFNEVVSITGNAMGKKVKVIHLPSIPCRAALKFCEKILRHPKLKEEQIRRLNEDKSFAHEEAAEDFDFSPRDFKSGITNLISELASTAESNR